MTRISPAIPAVPTTRTGAQSRCNMLHTRARLQGASTNSGANSPVIATPK